MKTNRLLSVALLSSLSCGLGCGGGGGGNQQDPLAKLELVLSLYMGNAMGATAMTVAGTSGTTKSNRPVDFQFNNTSDAITRIEVTRVINSVSKTCALLDQDGKVSTHLSDWAGATTDYTLKVYAVGNGDAQSSRTFGPYSITVEPAGIVVSNSGTQHDQADDTLTEGGAFFQTRTYAIGFGGYTGTNFNSLLAQYNPRLLDFATLTSANQLKAVSPDLIQSTAPFPRLVNDCGYETTAFQSYTGALDPSVAPLTAAQIDALPDPPAAATTLPLAMGDKFVYRTSDGKKGMVHIDTIKMSGGPVIGLHFSSEQ